MTAPRRILGLTLLAFVTCAPLASAEAPRTSIIPLVREAANEAPRAATPVTATVATRAPRSSLRPVFRGTIGERTAARAEVPVTTAAVAAARAAAVPPPATTRPAAVTASVPPVLESLRPGARSNDLEQEARATAARQTPSRVAQPGVRGALCGDPGLVGERLEPIVGRNSGCGIAEPIRLRSVDGIPLSTPATINCDTARALQSWLRNGLAPAVGRTGGGIANLRVAASYACRTRNHQPGARLSEHATGNAIDISGIRLVDGTEITVSDDWNQSRGGRILREAHQTACGPFGTVLGPNSDRFHRDHFHFDVASYRSGPYCR